ncbi:MAG TPA: TIGR02301 family protein [Xanthobacteraceae bacterium]
MVALMSTLRLLTVIALALDLAAGPANAQFPFSFTFPFQPRPQPPAPARPSPAAPKVQPDAAKAQPDTVPQPVSTPYDSDLQRLSEILGALHFLRGLCHSADGQKWRDEAQAMIDVEAPTGPRHDQLVASFNRGYRGFQQNYRTCTPAANLVIRRYLDEGAKIAREITARYAN